MKFELQKLPDFENVTKIFFVGIKGVGMAPIAMIAKGAGLTVAGSDVDEKFITDKYLEKSNIPIFTNFEVANIESFFNDEDVTTSCVITTGAHKGFDNPQVAYAKEKGITVLTQGQALALFMDGQIVGRDFKSVSIAGSHGKTTITSLLATTAKAMGLDPTYAIGTGEVMPLGAPGYLGRGDLFIAEADEYASEPVHDRIPKFLYQNPRYAIFNNIDFDHPDMFGSIEDIMSAFEELANNIQSGGILFINGDDPRLLKLKQDIIKDIRVVTYGANFHNDYIVSKIVSGASGTKFTVHNKNTELGVFDIALLGEHNAKNALSVIAFLIEAGYEAHKIKVCLREFSGSKRRSEYLGKTNGGATVLDDYGHHPLEISTTLKALSSASPGKKLIAIFQPHTYSRTKALLNDFALSFANAYKVILLPVFKSARDTEQDVISDTQVTDAFKTKNDVIFIENFDGVIEYCNKNFNSDEYVLVTIGAGDIYKIGEKLVD